MKPFWRAVSTSALLVGCGGSHMTPSDSVQVSAEAVELHECNAAYRGDAGAQAACRKTVTDRWDGVWGGYFADGGAR